MQGSGFGFCFTWNLSEYCGCVNESPVLGILFWTRKRYGKLSCKVKCNNKAKPKAEAKAKAKAKVKAKAKAKPKEKPNRSKIKPKPKRNRSCKSLNQCFSESYGWGLIQIQITMVRIGKRQWWWCKHNWKKRISTDESLHRLNDISEELPYMSHTVP